MEGFVELKTPDDLLKKLEHDYDIMVDQPGNTYAAFNFFVTAEHLPDWLHPGNGDKVRNMRNAIRDGNQYLRVVSHIANSAKHFGKLSTRHGSITGYQKDNEVNLEKGEIIGKIHIVLDPVKEKGLVNIYGNKAPALSIAKEVLKIWKKKINCKS